jgi:hypothetical protein
MDGRKINEESAVLVIKRRGGKRRPILINM